MNEPIISPLIFYLIGIAPNLVSFLTLSSLGMLLICFLLFFFKEKKKSIYALILSGFLGFFTVLIPPQDTMYKMMVASMVTPYNIQKTGEALGGVIDFTGEKADAFVSRLTEVITNSTVKVIQEIKK